MPAIDRVAVSLLVFGAPVGLNDLRVRPLEVRVRTNHEAVILPEPAEAEKGGPCIPIAS